MPSVPRIVVVDPAYEVARIVRGALSACSDRQHILIEVPTAEDALQEVLHSAIDSGGDGVPDSGQNARGRSGEADLPRVAGDAGHCAGR